ncbi:hypothetical protein HPP92_021466 [Vanilla planifolia]|uniref:Exonuclease domain-containing protein n=1 Tax=Vanilla planifolia TaxID=51239 RepID=A0A835UFJ2_VANPL|nr:hypothetical protein HPP92_021466 [Vanilla planifolia]
MASHEPVDGSPTRSSAPKNPNKRKRAAAKMATLMSTDQIGLAFLLDYTYGTQAMKLGKADVILKSPATKTICQQDIQELVTWVLANGVMPSWIFVKNKPLIRKVVLLYLPGVDADLYRSNPKLFCGLRKYCGIPQQVSALSCVADEMQTIGALLACRLKRKHAEVNSNQLFHNSDFGKETALFLKNQELAFPVLYYTHSRSELEDNGYCLSHPDFKSTFPAPAGTAPYNIVALDCEMCVTAEGFELTRATLIDCSGEVVLDELVKPVNCIIDYNTRYSGITEEMLNGVTTTLEDIQIQASGKGHDSIEDARAALELVLLKLRNGPQFGTNSSIVRKLVSVLQECGKHVPSLMICPMIKRYSDDSCNSIPVFTDNDALSRTIKESSEVAMRHGILDIEVKDILMQMNERIEKLYNTLPENAFVHHMHCYGDTAIVQRLSFKTSHKDLHNAHKCTGLYLAQILVKNHFWKLQTTSASIDKIEKDSKENHEPPLSRTEILQALEKLQVQAESALCFASVKHFT